MYWPVDRVASPAVGAVAEVKCRHCGGQLVRSSSTGLGQFYVHQSNQAMACDWGPTFKGSLYGTNADPAKVPEPLNTGEEPLPGGGGTRCPSGRSAATDISCGQGPRKTDSPEAHLRTVRR
jgi:hypothetical protein